MSIVISNIVFTRNRPLQLEAYLESLYRHIPENLLNTYVIYKVELFDEQYSELFKRFSNCIVIREQNFHGDFMKLLEHIDTKYILFGTDDVVYYDSVDFAVIDETFKRFPSDIFGFTLKFSIESLRDGGDKATEVTVAGQSVYKVNWKNAQNRHAKYPFELNSTVYKTALVKDILSYVGRERPLLKKIFPKESLRVNFLRKILSMKDFLISLETFQDPNSLEGYCCRWCKNHKPKFASYLFFQKLCASAIQVNRVNTTTANPVDGSSEHTIEELNNKYKQGYRLDVEMIERNKPTTTHIGRRYFRIIKSR